jgi:hypothetical protein
MFSLKNASFYKTFCSPPEEPKPKPGRALPNMPLLLDVEKKTHSNQPLGTQKQKVS